MRQDTPFGTPGNLLDVLLSELAARLAPLVAERLGQATPKYATAKHNPLGSERGFKAACASGAFETFKQGRQIAARWADVEAYVENRKRPPRAPPAPLEVDADRESLARMGVRLGPANDATRSRARRTR